MNNFDLAEQALCFAIDQGKHEFMAVAYQMQRPFMLLRPKMFPDGNQWCALYGENLQDGVCAFGDTPDTASINFDVSWLNQKCTGKQQKEAEDNDT